MLAYMQQQCEYRFPRLSLEVIMNHQDRNEAYNKAITKAVTNLKKVKYFRFSLS